MEKQVQYVQKYVRGQSYAEEFNGLEYSESLDSNPEFQRYLQDSKKRGFIVVPVKNAPGFYGAFVNGYLLIDESTFNMSSTYRHEVFHGEYWNGNSAAKKMFNNINYRSQAFQDFKAEMTQLYLNQGLGKPKDRTIAEELCAEFTAGVEDLAGAFRDQAEVKGWRDEIIQDLMGARGAQSERGPPAFERKKFRTVEEYQAHLKQLDSIKKQQTDRISKEKFSLFGDQSQEDRLSQPELPLSRTGGQKPEKEGGQMALFQRNKLNKGWY